MLGRIAPGGSRRRARGVGRGGGGIAALDVGEDLLDDGGVLSALASCVALPPASLQSDAGDDPHRPAAVLADFDIDPEHALEALCPSHGLASLGLGLVRIGLSPPAAPRRGDPSAVAVVRRK